LAWAKICKGVKAREADPLSLPFAAAAAVAVVASPLAAAVIAFDTFAHRLAPTSLRFNAAATSKLMPRLPLPLPLLMLRLLGGGGDRDDDGDDDEEEREEEVDANNEEEEAGGESRPGDGDGGKEEEENEAGVCVVSIGEDGEEEEEEEEDGEFGEFGNGAKDEMSVEA